MAETDRNSLEWYIKQRIKVRRALHGVSHEDDVPLTLERLYTIAKQLQTPLGWFLDGYDKQTAFDYPMAENEAHERDLLAAMKYMSKITHPKSRYVVLGVLKSIAEYPEHLAQEE